MIPMVDIFRWCFVVAMALCFTGACSPPDPLAPVANIGDETIAVGELQATFLAEMAGYPQEIQKNSNTRKRLLRRTLDEMIDRRLLLQAALQAGTGVEDSELNAEVRKYKSQYTEWNFQKALQESGITPEAWLQRKKENLLIKKYLDHLSSTAQPVTADGVKTYYETHPTEFVRQESVRVRQIVTDTKEKAESILRRLRNGENFAKLARDLSLSPDRKQGGDLGFIGKGSFPREFEVCFQMNPGEISPIIPSSYGFHLFKVLEKNSEAPMPLKEVEGRIALKLRQEAREAQREALLKQLKIDHPVQIQEEVLVRIK